MLRLVSGTRTPTLATERALELLRPGERADTPRTKRGYLDLLGGEDPTGALPGQRLMASNALPLIYERIWRPLGGRLLMGMMGPGMRGEHRIALEMLALSPGDKVLDVACGPGNFTREFARAVGDADGLVVGLDASRTMLDRAVSEGVPANVAYVRGGAAALPFPTRFDAVCCFAALYLIEEPSGDRGDRSASSLRAAASRCCRASTAGSPPGRDQRPGPRPQRRAHLRARRPHAGALRDHGLIDVRRRLAGFAQFVSGKKPTTGAKERAARGQGPRSQREERQAVRGSSQEGHEQGARGEDREHARRLQEGRQELGQEELSPPAGGQAGRAVRPGSPSRA